MRTSQPQEIFRRLRVVKIFIRPVCRFHITDTEVLVFENSKAIKYGMVGPKFQFNRVLGNGMAN